MLHQMKHFFTFQWMPKFLFGLLVGTGQFSLLTLFISNAAASDQDPAGPDPHPKFAIVCTVALAICCFGSLLFFLDHVSQAVKPSFSLHYLE